MIIEYCAENISEVLDGVKAGADRIEINDNIDNFGTTPSYGTLKTTVEYCLPRGIDVISLIRPRSGDFIYTKEEIQVMKYDITVARELNATGIAIGCLNDENRIDRRIVTDLISDIGELDLIFNRAFDSIPIHNLKEDINWLISQGFKRIIVHGGRTGTLFDNQDVINKITRYAKNDIEIMLGGGITYKNLDKVSEVFELKQYHGTSILKI